MSLTIEEPNTTNKKSFSLFNLGFRPFFLLAAFFAPLLMGLWLLQFAGKITLSSYFTPVTWHAHEMLFGYTVAVIAGFLLTAAGNWTGMKMISGWRLVLLSFVFLLGRFSPFIPDLPHWFIAAADLAFIPLVALIIALPVVRAKQWSNFIFIPLLLAMALANLLVHLHALAMLDIAIVTGTRAMLYLVVLLIIIMGGRVIPFFTEKGVTGVTTEKWRWIEVLSPVSLVLFATSDLIYGDRALTGYLALSAAIIHTVRLYGWYSHKIWQAPLVWVLQLAYGWFIIGFMIKSSVILNLTDSVFSYHAFTVGGIGIMTLGMMARVSLGHTGRELKINKWMVLSFVLINIAAIIRVFLPILIQGYYLQWIQLAGGLWIASFVIFLVVYTPMWIHSRVDGREG